METSEDLRHAPELAKQGQVWATVSCGQCSKWLIDLQSSPVKQSDTSPALQAVRYVTDIASMCGHRSFFQPRPSSSQTKQHY